MVRLRDLEDDFYEFYDKNYFVIGSRTQNKYKIGDSVEVMGGPPGLQGKQIDFKMINDLAPMAKGRAFDNGRSGRSDNRRPKQGSGKPKFTGKKSGFKKKRW